MSRRALLGIILVGVLALAGLALVNLINVIGGVWP